MRLIISMKLYSKLLLTVNTSLGFCDYRQQFPAHLELVDWSDYVGFGHYWARKQRWHIFFLKYSHFRLLIAQRNSETTDSSCSKLHIKSIKGPNHIDMKDFNYGNPTLNMLNCCLL